MSDGVQLLIGIVFTFCFIFTLKKNIDKPMPKTNGKCLKTYETLYVNRYVPCNSGAGGTWVIER